MRREANHARRAAVSVVTMMGFKMPSQPKKKAKFLEIYHEILPQREVLLHSIRKLFEQTHHIQGLGPTYIDRLRGGFGSIILSCGRFRDLAQRHAAKNTPEEQKHEDILRATVSLYGRALSYIDTRAIVGDIDLDTVADETRWHSHVLLNFTVFDLLRIVGFSVPEEVTPELVLQTFIKKPSVNMIQIYRNIDLFFGKITSWPIACSFLVWAMIFSPFFPFTQARSFLWILLATFHVESRAQETTIRRHRERVDWREDTAPIHEGHRKFMDRVDRE